MIAGTIEKQQPSETRPTATRPSLPPARGRKSQRAAAGQNARPRVETRGRKSKHVAP